MNAMVPPPQIVGICREAERQILLDDQGRRYEVTVEHSAFLRTDALLLRPLEPPRELRRR